MNQILNFLASCNKRMKDKEVNLLLKEIEHEFLAIGIKKDIDPRSLKASFNLVKHPLQGWLKSTKTSLHDNASLGLLDLEKMPKLKKLTDLIVEYDNEIQKKGGRIFITENLVYKMTKGSKHPIIFGQISQLERKPRNLELCEEIIVHGLGKDRFRVEETYILTKTANGEWSMSSSHENHSGIKKILSIDKMPLLKILSSKLNKQDAKFQKNGGRIFITPSRVYRVSNKVEIEFKL